MRATARLITAAGLLLLGGAPLLPAGAGQARDPRIVEFENKFHVNAWSNAYCDAFDSPDNHRTVYGMFLNVRAGSPVSPEQRLASVPIAAICTTPTKGVALIDWPSTLPEGPYLIAVQLEDNGFPRDYPQFRVLGIVGNAPADASLEDAALDRAMRR